MTSRPQVSREETVTGIQSKAQQYYGSYPYAALLGNCCSIRRSSVRALYIPDEDRQPSPAPPKFLPRWRLAHTARAKPGDAYDKARGAFDRIDRSRRPVLKERPAARQAGERDNCADH
jgi:hypothetical protein